MVENNQNIGSSKSKDDVEDYTVVAQRFLNIFRQLHVFTPERKKSFDDAILALPPEIRGSFGKLLGGSTLQEYVDELENRTGNVSLRDASPEIESVDIPTSKGASPISDAKSEQMLAKMIEISQKNAQASAQAQMQFQSQLVEALKRMPAGVSGEGSTITHVDFDSSKFEETISKIVKSQAELIANATKNQTEQLSRVIASSLKESYNYSTQSIVETLKMMNRDSLEAIRESFKLYANNQPPIYLSNYNVSGVQPDKFPPQAAQQQLYDNTSREIIYDKAPQEFYYETPKPQPRTEPQSIPQTEEKKDVTTQSFDTKEFDVKEEELTKSEKKKKKKKNKNKNNDETFSQNTSTVSALNEPSITPTTDLDDDFLGLANADTDISLDDISYPENDEPSVNVSNEEDNWEWVEETNNQKDSSPSLEPQKTDNTTAEDEWEYVEVEEDATEEPEYTQEEIENPVSEDEWEWIEEENVEENIENDLAPADSEEFVVDEPVISDEAALEEAEEEWEYVEEEAPIKTETEELPQTEEEEWEYVEAAAEGEDEEDYEWEYVEEEPETVNAAAKSDEEWEYVVEEQGSESEEEEWEWVEEEDSDEASLEEGEWEWEYEEVPEEEQTLVDQEPITFEEEYLEPEGEDDKKPAPISSDGILEKESMFKFDEENHKTDNAPVKFEIEELKIDPEPKDSSEPEDYWNLEEPESNELLVIEGNYDNLNINSIENNIIEDLEAIDTSLISNDEAEIDNIYVSNK